MIRVPQELGAPQCIRRVMPDEVYACLRLGGQLDQTEARLRSRWIRVIDEALELAGCGRINPGALQPRQFDRFIRDREGQDVHACIPRKETFECRAARVRTDHRQQLDIAVLQHGAAIADAPIGLARQRRQCEAQAFVLRGQHLQIVGDNANVIQTWCAHGTDS